MSITVVGEVRELYQRLSQNRCNRFLFLGIKLYFLKGVEFTILFVTNLVLEPFVTREEHVAEEDICGRCCGGLATRRGSHRSARIEHREDQKTDGKAECVGKDRAANDRRR